MSWPIVTQDTTEWLLGLEPEEVLYELCGPVIFTCRTDRGLMLAYLACETDLTEQYIVCPCTQRALHALVSCQMSVRQALTAGQAYLVEVDADGILGCWVLDTEQLSDRLLPYEGVMLRPSQPYLEMDGTHGISIEVWEDDEVEQLAYLTDRLTPMEVADQLEAAATYIRLTAARTSDFALVVESE